MNNKCSIPVCREYLNKEFCVNKARMFLHENSIRGMTKKQIAKEIYFHAVMYYYCERTGKFQKYKEHAGIVNLHDGGDTFPRRVAYAICWLLRKGDKA